MNGFLEQNLVHNTAEKMQKAKSLKVQNAKSKQPTEQAKLRKKVFHRNYNGFRNNPTIQKLSSYKMWTLSDQNKVPLHFDNYKTNKKWKNFYANFKGDNSALGTLPEIDSLPELAKYNRTYRMNASENFILCIDVEPYADEKTVQEMLMLPFSYGEISTNGGFHLLLDIPRGIIPPVCMDMIENTSVVKSKDYEVILNEHFMTFTQKTIPSLTNVEISWEYTELIGEFLMKLNKLNNKSNRSTTNITNHYVERVVDENGEIKEVMNYDVKSDDSVVATLIESYLKDEKGIGILQDSDDTFANYDNDFSRWEFNIIIKTLSRLRWLCDNKASKFLTASLTKAELSDKAYCHAVYELVTMFVPPREKHNTKRNNLPFLLSQTWRANDILANKMKK